MADTELLLYQDILTNIQNAIKKATEDPTDAIVGEIKKGDFFAKYRSLNELYALLENIKNKIKELEKEGLYEEFGCKVHTGCGL